MSGTSRNYYACFSHPIRTHTVGLAVRRLSQFVLHVCTHVIHKEWFPCGLIATPKLF